MSSKSEQTKTMLVRGALPPGLGCFWIESSYPNWLSDITGWRLWIRFVKTFKSPIHYECWVQNRRYLKNYKSQNYQIPIKTSLRTLHIFLDEKKIIQTILRIFNGFISKNKNYKIELLNFHSFQNIAQFFVPKKRAFLERGRGRGGGGGWFCISFTRDNPSFL